MTKGDESAARTYSSPSIAVDPENPQNVVAAFVEFRTGRCGLVRSIDGGRRWTPALAPPAPLSYPFCFTRNSGATMSPIAFGRHHMLYLAMGGWDAQDGLAGSAVLARSGDLGDHWRTTLVHDTRGQQGPGAESDRSVSSIAVDTRTQATADVLYVAWTRSYPNDPTRPLYPMIAVSTDGGQSFSAPINMISGYFDTEANRLDAIKDLPIPAGVVSNLPMSLIAKNLGGAAPSLTLDASGVVYGVWSTWPANITPPPLRGLYLSSSSDGGKTFTVTAVTEPGPTVPNAILRWSPKGGPQGALQLVYESKAPAVQGDRDIAYVRSTDGGQIWSSTRILNDDDPAQLAGQFVPNLSVSPDGRVDAVWWDFRNDMGTLANDVYLSSSSDGGATWSANTRVTERSVDRRLGLWSNNTDIRQPPGVASTTVDAVVGWDDTRNGTTDAQVQDIYSSRVQFRPVVTGPSAGLEFGRAVIGESADRGWDHSISTPRAIASVRGRAPRCY